MHNRRRILIPIVLIIILASFGTWYLYQQNRSEDNGTLQASGTVEAAEVLVSPEVPGSIAEVFVKEGDLVNAGEALFRLDDTVLQSQRQRAETGLESAKTGVGTAQAGLGVANAGLETAKAALDTAKLGVEAAKVQYELVLKEARLGESPARTTAWEQSTPSEFKQPVWYFDKAEAMAATEAEVEAAKKSLDTERVSLETVLKDGSNAELLDAEARLSKAQAAFLVAQDVLDRANAQSGKQVRDYAQSNFDAAKAELEASQSKYDSLLSSVEYADVLEARARVAVSQERYDTAQDRLDRMLTGDEATQVKAADIAQKQAELAVTQAERGVSQAEVNITQAEARLAQANSSIAQAQAELDLMDVQLGKLTVYAPASGAVLTRNIEPGEVVQPAAVALTIGQLDNLTITVYVLENRYGQVKLGMGAKVTVDSFPGEIFYATVVRVADQAEFTPRNVQTEEGRSTTVFAIELSVDNPAGKLKPGMPADVVFNIQ